VEVEKNGINDRMIFVASNFLSRKELLNNFKPNSSFLVAEAKLKLPKAVVIRTMNCVLFLHVTLRKWCFNCSVSNGSSRACILMLLY